MIPTVILVSFIVFFIIRLIPGDIIDLMAGQMEFVAVKMDRSAIEKTLGLDVSIPVQYARWIGFAPQADGQFSGVIHGDFGKSLWKGTPVLRLISQRWPVTLELGLLALVIAQLIALPIGVYSALRQDTLGDYLGRSFAIMCMAVPGFWIATLIIVFGSIWWGYAPPLMLTRFFEDPARNLKMFVLPAIVLGMMLSGATMRMTRNMMLEVLRQDYIRTAWSKGLKERVIITRHALKNALIPVVTTMGYQIPVLVGGSVIIEQIFQLPGMGRLLVQASLDRDYTVVSGVMLVFGVGMVVINLLVDLSYGFLDPRITFR
ncbi:MAG: ABC transporter permease [Spirochaetales bacterium]|nr:ABC transporter permease [Spirochaetales bacterium]